MIYKIFTKPNRIPQDGDVLDNATLNVVGSPILSLIGEPDENQISQVKAQKIQENSVTKENLNVGNSLYLHNGEWKILPAGSENFILTSTGWKKMDPRRQRHRLYPPKSTSNPIQATPSSTPTATSPP